MWAKTSGEVAACGKAQQAIANGMAWRHTTPNGVRERDLALSRRHPGRWPALLALSSVAVLASALRGESHNRAHTEFASLGQVRKGKEMATAMACTRLAAAPSLAVVQRSRFFGSSSSVAMVACSNGSRVSMSAEWLPGQPRPSYLDGTAPGDFGFDPLGLGEVPENLERYKESELIHCRWAMLAIPGILIPEALGLGNWVSAQKWAAVPNGQATYMGQPVPWGTLPIILAIEAIAIAFVEAKRNEEPDAEKRKYPGGAFDPLGFSKDPKKFEEFKLKEIKNGRLALLAFVGFSVQAIAYPGTGPLENLATHLADPWHKNIADIVIPRSIL